MRSYSEQGLVITLRQLKEADKLAVIWTKDKGKRSYVIKGASRILSRKQAALDSLNLINFMAVRSKTELDLLTEAQLIRDYREIKAELKGISVSMYMLEVLDRMLAPEQPNYSFFMSFLELLENFADNPKQYQLFLIYFQAKALAEYGAAPLLDACSYCYNELKAGEARMAANNNEPGFICDKHFANINVKSDLISDTILKILRFFSLNGTEEILKLNLKEEHFREIFILQNNWLEAVFEKRIYSRELIEQWKR